MQQQQPLRIGIMCGGSSLARWQQLCIEGMLADGMGEVALLILDAPENYPPRSTWQKIKEAGLNKALFNVYLRTAYRPRSVETVDCSALFKGVPSISCVVRKKGKWSQYFSEADVAAIRGHKLDVILRFGFNIIRGDILNTATYGVWSFHHDDEMKYRGGPPCFWEIYHRDPETGSILQRLTDRLDGGVVLKKGVFRTKSYSYAKNIDQAYFESAKWPGWVCRDILRGAADYLTAPPTTTSAPIYRYPTNGQFLRFLAILAVNFLGRVMHRLFYMEQWNVAVVDASLAGFLAAPAAAPRRFLKLKNGDTFNADCFGVKRAGNLHVLFEELDYSSGGSGVIRIARFDEEGREKARVMPEGLPANVHTSYPYLFAEGEDLYLVPETGALKETALYKAEGGDPARWTRVRPLLSGEKIFDATVLRHAGKYWLFYTVQSDAYDSDLHLHLAFSSSLEQPFKPHPGNPVKISARSARPAGTPFLDAADRTIRPAQNFSRTYGGSVVLNEITTLTEDHFEEREVGEILPFDRYYKDGLHTLAVVDGRTLVMDMKRHRFRFLWMLKKRGS